MTLARPDVRRIVAPLAAVVVVALCGIPSPAADASLTAAPTGSVRTTATADGADVTWAATRQPTSSYRVHVSDLSGGSAFTALTHQAYTFMHLSSLTAGHRYVVTVTAVPSGIPVGSAVVVPHAVPRSPLRAPTVVGISRTTLASGAPALVVRLAPQPGARYEAAEALTTRWKIAAQTIARPKATGEALVLGPLKPLTTYQVGVAAHDGTGQGAIKWIRTTSGAAACATGVCVRVAAGRASVRFAANGVLNSVPSSPDLFAPLRPAVFRANTGYGSRTGSAHDVSATGAGLIENLADAWYGKTFSTKAGGVQPPWECWSCYSQFITSEAVQVRASRVTPAYWEVMNEPGVGTYPAHLQGDAALYLRQLQVAAKAIRTVFRAARILAPTDGTFLTGGTHLDQPYLPLDAVLAHAGSIPGFAGVDWHEIAAGSRPQVAAGDVASARTLESLAGRSGLAVVVSEYTTPLDAPLAGAAAGWLSALTTSNVTYASRACYTGQPVGTSRSTCTGQLADGLFTTSGRLTGPGLVASYYPLIAAGIPRAASSSDADTSVLASVNGRTASILLGSSAVCVASVSGSCPTWAKSTARRASVRVSIPMSSRPSSARVVIVPAGGGAGHATTTTVPVGYSDGVAHVVVSLPYAAAAYVTIT